jgi:hypothetical protein
MVADSFLGGRGTAVLLDFFLFSSHWSAKQRPFSRRKKGKQESRKSREAGIFARSEFQEEALMTGEELFRWLDRVITARGMSLRHQEAVSPTMACFSVPRLDRGARTGDWTEQELRHLAGCLDCRRALEITAHLAPLEENGVSEDRGEWAARIEDHLAVCPVCRLAHASALAAARDELTTIKEKNSVEQEKRRA